MAIVNFMIPETLEKRVNKAIKEKGFASKAEFFRFAAVHFLDLGQPASEEERFAVLSATLKSELTRKFKGEVIPSTKTQLSDL